MLKLTHAVVDIAITCSHFEESLHFYRDLLGLDVTLDIEISEDDYATQTGLMYRTSMKEDQAMLFIFEKSPKPK